MLKCVLNMTIMLNEIVFADPQTAGWEIIHSFARTWGFTLTLNVRYTIYIKIQLTFLSSIVPIKLISQEKTFNLLKCHIFLASCLLRILSDPYILMNNDYPTCNMTLYVYCKLNITVVNMYFWNHLREMVKVDILSVDISLI